MSDAVTFELKVLRRPCTPGYEAMFGKILTFCNLLTGEEKTGVLIWESATGGNNNEGWWEVYINGFTYTLSKSSWNLNYS